MIFNLPKVIKEPFWSAGSTYGWGTTREEKWGVGISTRYFRSLSDEDELRFDVIIAKDDVRTYKISKVKARELVNKYNSLKKVKADTELVILPIMELERVEKQGFF